MTKILKQNKADFKIISNALKENGYSTSTRISIIGQLKLWLINYTIIISALEITFRFLSVT